MIRRMTATLHHKIEAMLADGDPTASIMRVLDVSEKMVGRVRRGRYRDRACAVDLPAIREEALGPRKLGGGYTPTPEEIERHCFALRMQRPDDEPEPWTPPEVCLTEVVSA